jgi:GNAT superfamily N-acetyltransferase
VSQAKPADLEAVASLLMELDDFYGERERESATTKIAHMQDTLFGASPSAFLLLARDRQDGSIVGLAAYSYLWPAVGTTRSLYLKELYVRKDRRGTGVGRVLMERLFEVARENGCSRAEWTTDRENSEAQGFYRSLGVEPNSNKLFYRREIEPRATGG